MNGLLKKLDEFRSISNFRMLYELEDGQIIDFKLKQTDFPHLIGLHKLIDLPIIRRFNDTNSKEVSAKYLISKIRQEKILTESEIRQSYFFKNIEKRYNEFGKENLLSVSYTEAIVDFEASVLGSALNADYILFENKDPGYNHLCVAQDKNGDRYAESFFYHEQNDYINNQKIVKVKKVIIYDNQNNIYLEDTLLKS